jgi:prepilin-type N-terminal cleavage/methylation domain-containing protein
MINRKKGFTLIELLVVISIIALLSSIVLASLNSARTKAREAAQQVAIDQTKKALQLYWTDHGSFPNTVDELVAGSYISAVDANLMTYTPFDVDGETCIEGEICESYEIKPQDLEGGGIVGGEELVVDACTGTETEGTIGTICQDGTVYVSQNLRTTPTDYSTNPGPFLAMAGACATYNTTRNETGWRVPTPGELSDIFYLNRTSIGGFNRRYYASSVLIPPNLGASWDFTNNVQVNIPVQIYIMALRCIRDI